MSDGGGSDRDWRLYARDMMERGLRIRSFTSGIDKPEFLADIRTYDATLYNLALVGEAATHIPASVREAQSDIPWSAIIGIRQHIIHGYLGVDSDLIWSVVQNDIPALLFRLSVLLEAVE